MSQTLSPAVILREIQTGARAIQGVGTSVAGFLGLFQKGPIGVPRLITSIEQFQSIYGGTVSFGFAPDAIQGFFDNEGNACWVVRTADYSDPSSGTLNASANAKATQTLNDRSAGAGTPSLTFDALNEGEWGNDLSINVLTASQEQLSFNRVLGSDGGVFSVNTSAAKTPGLFQSWSEVGGVFTDQTATLKTVGGGTAFAIPSVTGDSLYLASKDKKFNKFYFDLDTAGTDGATQMQYWDGEGWKNLARASDATTDFTAAAADNLLVEFTAPADWALTEINGDIGFYIRFLVTTDYTIAPEISRVTFGEDRPFGMFTAVADASLEVAAATALNDAAYFGSSLPFNFVELDLATAGDATGELTWEYWNGNIWTAVSGVTETATGAQHMRASGTVGFTMPSDWRKNSVNAEEFYWLRARISTNYASDYPSAEHALPSSDLFRLQILESGVLVEDFDNLTLDSTAVRYVEKVVGTTAEPFSEYVTVTDLGSTAASPNNRPRKQLNTSLAGGVYTVSSVGDGDYIGSAGAQTGLFAFDPIDEVNMLCVPGIKTEAVHLNMLNYAERRGDLIAILDSIGDASNVTVEALVEYVRDTAALNSSYGAIYDYWIEVPDLITNNPKVVPPCGHIAGMFARTDFNRGVWKSPAGETDGRLFGATGVVRNTSKGERDFLYPNKVNSIRDKSGVGVHVDGGKTLAPQGSDFDRVAIRRLFLFAEESIQEGLQFIKHEPNSEVTRRRVTATVGAFLLSLWQDGALNGTQPSDAFFVVCNESNNPPSVQRQYRLNCRIGIAPLYPAEFIHLTFEVDQRALNAELASFGII